MPTNKKNPFLAILLSLLVAGLGNLYINSKNQRRLCYLFFGLMLSWVAIGTIIYIVIEGITGEISQTTTKNMELVSSTIGLSLSIISGYHAYLAANFVNKKIDDSLGEKIIN